MFVNRFQQAKGGTSHLAFPLHLTSRPVPKTLAKGERIAADDARVEEFVSREVPKIVDEQSGVVTRKLQKAHETFDIENAKIAKREQKVRGT